TTRPSSTGSHLLIHSAGVKMLAEGEWKTKRHGADCWRRRRRVQLGVDTQALQIRAIEIKNNAIGDASRLPKLPTQTPVGKPQHSVSSAGI
ncbi:MAG: IS5/IS1182 family transposase, partial [Burkholderiaceae bacterium]